MSNSAKITSVQELIAKVGRDTLIDGLGHTPQVVSRAVTENIMPAHWYVSVRDVCSERGFSISESLFKWKRKTPSTTQNANYTSECQEMVSNAATIGGDA